LPKKKPGQRRKIRLKPSCHRLIGPTDIPLHSESLIAPALDSTQSTKFVYCRIYPCFSLNWTKGYASLGRHHLPLLQRFESTENYRGVAKLSNTIHIPAHSACFATAIIGKPYNTLCNLLFEPKLSFHISFSLSNPVDSKFSFSVLNTSNKPTTLYKNCKVGKVCLYAKPAEATEQQSQLKNLLQSYSDMFVVNGSDLGSTDLVYHKIKTGNAEPNVGSSKNLGRATFRKMPEAGLKIAQKGLKNTFFVKILPRHLVWLGSG